MYQKVCNIAENFNHLSRAHERYRRQTDDRQTTDDRRQTTDGRTTTYSEHELEFTFAKNLKVHDRETNKQSLSKERQAKSEMFEFSPKKNIVSLTLSDIARKTVPASI